MSTFRYQGIAIHPVLTKTYTRTPIYDGPVYLYTRHKLKIQGIYNPTKVSYGTTPISSPGTGQKVDDGFLNPVINAGQLPAETDYTIRHRLMQPRGKLYFTAGYPAEVKGINQDPAGDAITTIFNGPGGTQNGSFQPVINTPAVVNNITYKTDVTNGPMPLGCDVTRIGTQTWWVDFSIQTDINECFLIYNTPQVLLSNRWTMSHDVDEMAFTTRHVNGRAIFRADVLAQTNNNPDDYRRSLFFPVPNNFMRKNIRVEADRDGLAVNYSFTDKEVSHQILYSNIRKIEAWMTLSTSREGFVSAGIGAAAGAGQIIKVGKKNGVVAGILEAISVGVKNFKGVIPTLSVNLNVRVWGSRRAVRAKLLDTARAVLKAKLPLIGTPASFAYGYSGDQTADLMGRYVGTSATFVSGPALAGVENLLALITGASTLYPEFLVDDIGVAGTPGGVATINNTPGYTMPGRTGTAGTYLESCVAQALSGQCSRPPDPYVYGESPNLVVSASP